jgi:hypothetical protein
MVQFLGDLRNSTRLVGNFRLTYNQPAHFKNDPECSELSGKVEVFLLAKRELPAQQAKNKVGQMLGRFKHK